MQGMSQRVVKAPLTSHYRRVWGLESSEPFSSLAPYLPSTLLPGKNVTGLDPTIILRKPSLLQLCDDQPHIPPSGSVAAYDELFIAAGEAHADDIRTVINRDYHSMFPTVLDERNASVLHVACGCAESPNSSGDVLKYLVGLPGAFSWITHKNSAGMTPLMTACAAGSISAVAVLLKARPDREHINAHSAHGCTALHISVDGGHEDISLMLVQAGASVFTRASFQLDSAHAMVAPYISPLLAEFGITPLELASLKCPSEFMQHIIHAVVGVLRCDDAPKGPVITSTSDDGARLLSFHKKRAIAQSLLAEGFKSATVSEVVHLLGDVFFSDNVSPPTERDVMDIVALLDSNAIHSSIVLSKGEEEVEDLHANRRPHCNRNSPSWVTNVQVYKETNIGSAIFDSPSALCAFIRAGGSAVAVATLGHAILHGHHGTLPSSVRQLLTDFSCSFEVSVKALHLVVELEPLVHADLLKHADMSMKVILLISHDLQPTSATTSAMMGVPPAPFHAAAVILVNDPGDVTLFAFEAPVGFLGSICEVTDAAPVNFDESIGHCCLTRNRGAFQRVSGVHSIVPFSSLFNDFDRLLFSAVASARISPMNHLFVSHVVDADSGATPYDARMDLLTHAIEAHADSVVSFLLCSPYCQVEQRHLVVAAQRGTAASFQLVFSAMGSVVSALSTIDPHSGETPVTAAIACGTCLHLTSLLQIASRELQSPNALGFSPLMVACLKGNEGALLQLISLGADVNECCPHGMTPLIAAIASSVDRVVMPLVQNGAFPHQPDANGLTPLRAAELFGSSAIFPLLHHQHDTSSSPSSNSISSALTFPGTQPESPKSLLAAAAAATLDQLRLLEAYFAEISEHHLPQPANAQLSPTSPVFLKTELLRIPIYVHDIQLALNPDVLVLCNAIRAMVHEVSTIVKALLLEPQVVMLCADALHDHAAILALFHSTTSAVTRLVERFRESPPAASPSTIELEKTVQLAQHAVNASHRFVVVVQSLHQVRSLAAQPASIHSMCDHPTWRRAIQALPSANLPAGVVPPFCVPTSLVVQSLEASLPLLRDHQKLTRVIGLLLDPFRSGTTTVFEFHFVHQLLSEFSDEGLASLHVLLGFHEVFLNGFAAINEIWLRRSTVYKYAVVLGPVGVTLLTCNPGGTTSERTYRSVESLLMFEADVLRV